MAGATITTHSTIVRPSQGLAGEISDAVFRNSDLLSLFRVVDEWGASYKFNLIVAGNDSVATYSEGDADPAAGYQQVVTATAAFKHFRIFTRMTGHLRRQLGATWDMGVSGPGSYAPNDFEAAKAKEDMVDLISTTFGGTKAIYSIPGIIDDATTNFYDLSRSTYSLLVSKVVAGGSAAVTVALLNSMLFGGHDAPYGAPKFDLILCSPTQGRKIANLISGSVSMPSAGDLGGGSPQSMPPFGGVRIALLRDLVATEIFALSGMNTSWMYVNNEPAPGRVDELPYGVQTDAKVMQYSTAGCLVCKEPSKQAKIEALGTT
jgi:hypothetical protein